jgi:hypothetical protein
VLVSKSKVKMNSNDNQMMDEAGGVKTQRFDQIVLIRV